MWRENVLNEKLCFILITISMFTLVGCQMKPFVPIPKEKTVIMTVNVFDSSLSFIDVEREETFATWSLPFPVERATLFDDDFLLLYGKTIPHIYVYQLSTGKKIDTWNVESGVSDVKVATDRMEVYATIPKTNELLVLSPKGEIEAKQFVGENPESIIIDDERLLVLTYGDDHVTVVNRKTKQVVKRWKSTERAIDGAITSNGSELWIGGHGRGANMTEHISIFDVASGELLEQIYAPVMPVIFERHDPYMYVLSHGSNKLYKIELQSRNIVAFADVGANPFAIVSYDGKLYVAGYDSNDVTIVSSQDLTIVKNVAVGDGPINIIVREAREKQ